MDIKKIEDKVKYAQEFDKMMNNKKIYRKPVNSINKFKKNEEENPRCLKALIFQPYSE